MSARRTAAGSKLRRALEEGHEGMVPKKARVWKCGVCTNVFATSETFKSESCDGYIPRCCPYCGQIPEEVTELA
jgi:rubrerythrin